MPLNPFQPRRAAPVAVSLLISTICAPLLSPQLVWATDVPLEGQLGLFDDSFGLTADLSYEPDFSAFDRSIIGRQDSAPTTLENNQPKKWNLQPGAAPQCYKVSKDTIFQRRSIGSPGQRGELDDEMSTKLPRDEKERTIYISANTCLQPKYTGKDMSKSAPPQLTLYFTNATDASCPDASTKGPDVTKLEFDQGAVMHSANVTGDVYISIVRSDAPKDFDKEGIYNFEVAFSTDDYYHQYEKKASELVWLDSDSNSALLSSKDLTDNKNDTKRILEREKPFELYIYRNDSAWMHSLRHSACGLSLNANISAKQLENGKWNDDVRTKMTTNGPSGLPKQQFYVPGLGSNLNYSGVLVSHSNISDLSVRADSSSDIGRGGRTFAGIDFSTLSGTNCHIITDLEFCDEIQYAVPGNGEQFNSTELAKKYDAYAKKMYQSFEKVMMQIQCETTSTQKYSLVRTCEDCKQAYKRWLCTVTMPRCEDIMSLNPHAIMRNIGQAFPNGTKLPDKVAAELSPNPALNKSRNNFIDTDIKPGPYKEILPCDDVCYDVVQSCPAAIGFRCPQPKMTGFNTSYGVYDETNNDLTCNFAGEARTRPSGGSVVSASVIMAMVPMYLMLLI